MKNLFLSVITLLMLTTSAFSGDNYKDRLSVCDSANRKETCQQWVAQTKMPDNRMVSCCGDADAFITDGYVFEDGKLFAIFTEDYPSQIQNNTPLMAFKKGDRIEIPINKINDARLDGGNPSGHSVTFINPYNGQVYCYFGPTGV